MSEAQQDRDEAKLGEYDFIVVIDKSSSMGEPVSATSSRTRWEAVQESAVGLCRDISKFDSDGLGLVLFSGTNIVSEDGCNVDKVRSVFANNRPGGSTPLAEALQAAFKLAGKSDKKDFIVVFTDGVPDDRKAAADVIRKQSNSQASDDACTVLFIQVGDDPKATEYLRKLDDELTGCKYDIVDAKTMDEADKFPSTAALILAAIDD